MSDADQQDGSHGQDVMNEDHGYHNVDIEECNHVNECDGSYDRCSDLCEEEYKKSFKNSLEIKDEYEADFQCQTVYHKGDNNGRHMNEYEFLGVLGKGSFGKVKKVERKYLDDDGTTVLKSYYAAKIFKKTHLEHERVFGYKSDGESFMTNRLHLVYEEINIYKHLNHPNICKLYQVIDDETDEKLYLIMEYCDLGQLMEWNEDTQQYLPNTKLDQFVCSAYNVQEELATKRREIQAKIIFKQVAQGIQYLHSSNTVNRDIKIDNILCRSDQEKGEHFKLADHSTTKKLANENEKLRDCAGTSGFRCPEQQFCLDIGYDGKACDVWSLGITILTYINYKIPFWSDSVLQTDIQAKNNPLTYEQHNSDLLKDLVESMCRKQEHERIKIDQVLSHPFFIVDAV